jgi:hypothetical protein
MRMLTYADVCYADVITALTSLDEHSIDIQVLTYAYADVC